MSPKCLHDWTSIPSVIERKFTFSRVENFRTGWYQQIRVLWITSRIALRANPTCSKFITGAPVSKSKADVNRETFSEFCCDLSAHWSTQVGSFSICHYGVDDKACCLCACSVHLRLRDIQLWIYQGGVFISRTKAQTPTLS